jgi:hypothetical protein
LERLKLVWPVQPVHVFLGLVVFWAVWIYSEWEERSARDRVETAFNAFQAPGQRFTKEDGEELSRRIKENTNAIQGQRSALVSLTYHIKEHHEDEAE